MIFPSLTSLRSLSGTLHRTQREKVHRATSENQERSRRRSDCRSTAPSCRECILKKIECLGYREGTAREKAQVIWELRHEHKIGLLIEIADIPRSTYYYYSKQFDHPKPDRYAEIKTEILRIYDESKGRYGYRRITKELRKKFVVNHKTVQKLMRKMDIFCRVRMHKYNSYNGDVGRIAPNLLERDFKADKPNQKWVTDVTEFALFGIKLYLSPIIDLYNGEVISYNLSRHPNLNQVTDMLEKAFSKILDNTNLILHSDQGWQYQHKHYQKNAERERHQTEHVPKRELS